MARKIPVSYTEARKLADEARARAFKRVDYLTETEKVRRARLARDPRQREYLETVETVPLNIAVDRRVSDDAAFKLAVADNRWYIDYATMYAQGEVLTQLAEMTNILNAIYLRLVDKNDSND